MGTSDHRPSGPCLCRYPSTSSWVMLLDHVMYQNTIILLEIAFHVFLLYVRYGAVLIFFLQNCIIYGFHFRDRKEPGSKCLLSKEGVRFERVVSSCLTLIKFVPEAESGHPPWAPEMINFRTKLGVPSNTPSLGWGGKSGGKLYLSHGASICSSVEQVDTFNSVHLLLVKLMGGTVNVSGEE